MSMLEQLFLMNKKMFKKFFIYFISSLIISSFLTIIYVFFPNLLDSFDNRIRDSYFLYKGETQTTNSINILNIDEESLQEFGQWPWSRDILSKIVDNLNEAGVAAIAMDIVFSEEDRTSPSKIVKKLNRFDLDEVLDDYDEIFSKSIEESPVILGYSFDLEKESINQTAPKIPVIFIEKNKSNNYDYIIKAYGTTLNLPVIQNAAYTSGFFNIIPDESGVIRSVPLLISYNDTLYPSLSLETIRVLNGIKKVIVNYDENGVSNIQLGDYIIPTDRYGRLYINYRGAAKTFKYLSAKDIYYNNFKKEDVEEKIILLGTSATGLYDLRATPYENVFPGVEIHANVMDNILEGDFLQKASYLDGVNIVLIIFFTFIIFFLVTFSSLFIKVLLFTSSFILYIVLSYKVLFDYGYVLNIIFPLLAMLFAFIVSVIIEFFYNLKQEKAIKGKFASKVSKSVMDELLKNIDKEEFSAKDKEITVFFSDIRGFTSISEKLTAKELISYLNNYMEPMSNIIIKNKGTIDKFIGDSIMAYWNAPLDVTNHADMAVKSAIEQMSYLEILNKELKDKNLPKIDIGIGINSGDAVVGEMGSKKRSDYTVIGDMINLGSRVESLCKFYGSKINITNYTKELLKDSYTFRFLDFVRVKGKDKPVEIWQVMHQKITPKIEEELELYSKAIKLYQEQNFKESLKIFETLDSKEEKTNNCLFKIYINRCNEYIKNPPLNFDGVYEHLNKS